MKKIIYTFIFLLPVLLFSCSGSNNETELKKQLEVSERQNQELINKTKLAAEIRAKEDAEAKLAAEIRAKEDAEAKLAAEIRAKEDAEAKLAAEIRTKEDAEAKLAAEKNVKQKDNIIAEEKAESREWKNILSRINPLIVRIQTLSGVGSGFIYKVLDDKSALVMTNHHVIKSSYAISITMDNTKYESSLFLEDPWYDIALLKFCCVPHNYDYNVEFQVLNQNDIGSELATIGFPLGSQNISITSGLFSSIKLMNNLDYIQTDSAINPGNSGGPLINRDGKIVGLITSKEFLSKDGRPAEGIGYALSSKYFEIIEQRVKGRSTSTPSVSRVPIPLTPSVSRVPIPLTPSVPPPPPPPPPVVPKKVTKFDSKQEWIESLPTIGEITFLNEVGFYWDNYGQQLIRIGSPDLSLIEQVRINKGYPDGKGAYIGDVVNTPDPSTGKVSMFRWDGLKWVFMLFDGQEVKIDPCHVTTPRGIYAWSIDKFCTQ